MKQLQLRFGPIPESVEQRLVQANPADLDQMAERVLTAASLDEVFAPQS